MKKISLPNLLSLPKKSKNGPQVIDGVSVAVDLAVFNLAILAVGVPIVTANVIAVTLALIFIIITKRIPIDSQGAGKSLNQAALFILVAALAAYLIQAPLVHLLTNIWTAPVDLVREGLLWLGIEGRLIGEALTINAIKAVAVSMGLVWSYWLNKKIVFNPDRGRVFDVIGDWLAAHRQTATVAVVMLVAVLFRFWQLPGLPPGLLPHEASHGLSAIAAGEGEWRAVFGQAGDRESLLLILQTLMVAIFGNTLVALKLAPAIISLLAVFATYKAAREWFSYRVGVIAAFFMATMAWATQIGRLSEPLGVVVLLVPLLMWLMAKAVRTDSAILYVAGGITFAGLLYTGIPYFTWLVLIALTLLYCRRYYRDYSKKMLQPALIVVLSATLTALPLAFYKLLTGGGALITDWWQQIAGIAQQPLLTAVELGNAIIVTLAMFHFRGDADLAYNLSMAPLLNALFGILLLLAVILAIKRFRDVRYFALLALSLTLLLPAFFAFETAPSAIWSIGLIPLVSILAAIGLVELAARWKGIFPYNPLAGQVAMAVMVAALLLSATYEWRRYFVAWAGMPEVYELHHEAAHQAGKYITTSDFEEVYIVNPPETSVILEFLTYEETTYFIEPEEFAVLELESGQAAVILNSETEAGLEPAGDHTAEEIYSPSRPQTLLFTVYTHR